MKELIVTNLDIAIPKRVYEETVKIPMGRGFPDAGEMERNVNSENIQVNETEREKKGEFEAVNLFKSGDFDAIVSDDGNSSNSLAEWEFHISHHLH